MPALTFAKYEGLGNDFVVVELPDPTRVPPDRVVEICDRHRGVGADGVLVVAPPSSSGADVRMIVLNADGSRPEMCGNGLRCVALHLARAAGDRRGEYSIETDAGVLRCRVERDGAGGTVTAEMGRAVLGGSHRDAGTGFEFALVSTGNPHAVTFQPEFDAALVDEVGPRVSRAQPRGANVEFARPGGSEAGFEVIVWERGVGRTMACGTGAVATAVAACSSGRAAFGEPVPVTLPGGTLVITVQPDSLATSLCGPARRVFAGELELP